MSFLCVLSLTALIGAFSIAQIGDVHATAKAVSNETLPSTRHALMMKAILGRMRASELQDILSSDEKDYSYYEKG